MAKSTTDNQNLIKKYQPIEIRKVSSVPGNVELHELKDVAIDDCIHWDMNVRFSPSKPMTEDEHLTKIKDQAPVQFTNLLESIKMMGILEALLVIYDEKKNKFVVHAGNRRYFCAKLANLKHIRVLRLVNYTEKDLKKIRDLPEIKKTKVDHDPLYIAKAARDAITNAKTKEERDAVYAEAKYRWNFKEKDVDQKKRVVDHIMKFRKARGEEFDKDSDAYKAFETFDNLNQGPLEKLRHLGQHAKVKTLMEMGESFLDNRIAHDDMFKAINVLSTKTDHPLWSDINSGVIDIKSRSALLSLKNLLGDLEADSKDIAEALRKSIQRAYLALEKSRSHTQCNQALLEIGKGKAKIEGLLKALSRIKEKSKTKKTAKKK